MHCQTCLLYQDLPHHCAVKQLLRNRNLIVNTVWQQQGAFDNRVLLSQGPDSVDHLADGALVMHCQQVIMYDEPTAGLDPVASTVVEDLIRSMHAAPGSNGAGPRSGITSYIVVTHQHSTIRRAVDRIIFLHEVTDLCLNLD